MSLFREIRRLCSSDRNQLEDIHTEVVAAVLRNSPELTLAWLGGLGVTNFSEADSMEIITQERFALLDGYDSENRIDMTIRLRSSDQKQVVYVESKVASGLGWNQLNRYAEQLAFECRNTDKLASLVFITRDFEPTEKPKVEGFPFQFCQTRWFEFYRHLKARSNSDGLEEQLKLFMQENHMSTGNRFRSTDLVALENFLEAKSLMNETLSALSDHGNDSLGKFSNVSRATAQLRIHHRYIRYIFFGGFELLVGYWLPSANPDDSVWIGVELNSNPTSPHRKAIVKAFQGWMQRPENDWESNDLEREKEWATIFKGKSLNSVLSASDHVQEVKSYFSSLLAEVIEFRAAHPELQWKNLPPADEEPEDQ